MNYAQLNLITCPLVTIGLLIFFPQIRAPKRLEATFSVDGVSFPTKADIQVDFRGQTSLQNIDLRQKSGRSVQLKVFFADDWIVLSEIRFKSGNLFTLTFPLPFNN